MKSYFNRKYLSLLLLSLLTFLFIIMGFFYGFSVIDIPEVYMVELVEGRAWVSSVDKSDTNIDADSDNFLDDSSWVLLTSPRLLSAGSIVKTESDGLVKMNFINLGEIRLSASSSISVDDIGKDINVNLNHGRAWINYSGEENFTARVQDVVIKTIDDSSFWINSYSNSYGNDSSDNDSNNAVEIGSVTGELKVKASNDEIYYFDDNVIAGDLITIKNESVELSKLSSEEMESDWIVSEINNDLVNNLIKTGTENKKVIELRESLNANFDPLIDVDDVSSDSSSDNEIIIGGGGEIIPEGEGSDFEVSVNDVLKFGGGELDKIPLNILPDKKIAGSVYISADDFNGAEPLIAKWYYEEKVEGGPVFMELKVIDEPGNYKFEFPIYAKPTFLEGDEWPKGKYFAKIYYGGTLISEYSVNR